MIPSSLAVKPSTYNRKIAGSNPASGTNRRAMKNCSAVLESIEAMIIETRILDSDRPGAEAIRMD
jgi:hypothetical protein